MTYDIFERRYSLIIGRPSTKILQTIPRNISAVAVPRYLAATKLIKDSTGDISDGVGVGYRTIPDEFIELRDLSMRAKVVYKKTGSKGGNQFSTIDIDNLTEETKNNIRVNDFIFLRAGYKKDIGSSNIDYEDLPLILSGQITKVETRREPTSGTRVTSIICGDNILPKKSIKVSKGWPSNTSKRKVLDDLLDIAKGNFISVGRVQEEMEGFISPFKEVYPYGYSVTGDLFEELQKLCDSVDYRFYTALGKIYVEPKRNIKTFETVLIEPETLKAPPEKYSDGSSKKTGSKESPEGITLRTFLNGRVLSNMVVNISGVGEEWEGSYPIESVMHSLDFEGNKWDTEIKTVRL